MLRILMDTPAVSNKFLCPDCMEGKSRQVNGVVEWYCEYDTFKNPETRGRLKGVVTQCSAYTPSKDIREREIQAKLIKRYRQAIKVLAEVRVSQHDASILMWVDAEEAENQSYGNGWSHKTRAAALRKYEEMNGLAVTSEAEDDED
jgi:hypothetical protein